MTTRQDIIRRALAGTGTFISAQDLHARLRSAGHPIGLTTIYRTLHALARDGVADTLRDENGQHLYRACGRPEHHHHLLCRACGAAAEVPASALERWAAAVSAQHGFTDVTLTAEFFGTCAGCSSIPARRETRCASPWPRLAARAPSPGGPGPPGRPAEPEAGRRLTEPGPSPSRRTAPRQTSPGTAGSAPPPRN